MGLFLREERAKGRWGGRKGRTEGRAHNKCES